MVLSKILPGKRMRPAKTRPVAIEAIDAALDVPTTQFERASRRLANRMRKELQTVDLAGYRSNRSVPAKMAEERVLPDARGGFYQVEIRRFPPLDRDEEFRMARRYEFFKLRLQLELQAMGVPSADAAELVKLPRRQLLQRLQVGPTAYMEVCLQELEDLRNLYIEGALHIVLGTVARYRGLGVDSPDLIQEGNASLFQAIEGFDWRREVRFRTYAQYWVQQAVLKMLYNSARTVRVPIWVQKALGKIRRVQDSIRREGGDPGNAEVARRLGLTEDKVAWVLNTKRFAVSLDAEVGGDDGATLAQLLPDESVASVPDSVPEGDLRRTLAEAMGDLPDRERMIIRRRFGLGGSEPETLGAIAADLGVTAERVRQLQNAALSRLQKPGKLRHLKAFLEPV